MKKKTGLILGCILFVVLAVGSVPSGNKDNVEVKNNSSSQETQSSTNNSTEQQSQQETKKEYEILEHIREIDSKINIIIGKMENLKSMICY